MNQIPYIACCSVAAISFTGIFTDLARAANSPFANPPSSYLLQVNGRTVREINPDSRRAPASLTKIMTALIVLEKCRPDEVVTVSRRAARETGSRIGLRRGDRLTVRDLLAAALIASANDAARALAEHTSGSQKAFVALMNTRARALKLQNTRYTNACGHDDPGLYSSAHDLSILAERALQQPLFADIVATRSMRITTVKGGRSFQLKNVNRLIGRYPGALGVKTGTTPKAGQCLVALAKRNDRKVLLVIMNSRHRWQTAPAMLDAAFGVNSAAEAKFPQQKVSLQEDSPVLSQSSGTPVINDPVPVPFSNAYIPVVPNFLSSQPWVGELSR
jgi:serine-type D-Ala-D-Ala carboxypeptidase (penicillin-binding protein 5/6)